MRQLVTVLLDDRILPISFRIHLGQETISLTVSTLLSYGEVDLDLEHDGIEYRDNLQCLDNSHENKARLMAVSNYNQPREAPSLVGWNGIRLYLISMQYPLFLGIPLHCDYKSHPCASIIDLKTFSR